MDNIFIERLWRSLKYEAGYLHELTDGFKAERAIGEWIDFTIPRGLIQPTTAKRRRRPMAPGSTTTATGCDKQDFGDIIRQQNTP